MKFLQIQKFCLNSIGYSFQVNESRLRRIYSLCWISSLIIVIPEMHFVIANISDIPLVTDALCTLLTCILASSKLITIYFNKGTFYHIIKELDEMWLKAPKNDRVFLEEGLMVDSYITLTYFISAMGVAMLYLSLPIIKATYEILTIGTTVWIMPMRSLFIYDISISPNYELTYLWFVQCTWLVAIGSVGVDCLFYGSSLNIASHFRIIQNRLHNLKFDRIITEHGRHEKQSVVLSDEFRSLIQYHQKILDICEKFCNLYSAVLFIQCMITSVQLCVIAFQLTLPDQEVIMKAIFVLFLLAICFQLFTYCHAGTQLTTESAAVANAIYSSYWYECSPSTRRSIVFFIMRSQKSVVVYSGFYEASLETFKSILGAAASYMTILQSLVED